MLNEWLSQFKPNTSNDSQNYHNPKGNSLLDIHLAQFLANKTAITDDLVMRRFCFLVLSLSKQVRAGHVCLDLTNLNCEPEIGLDEPSLDDWHMALQQAAQKRVVSDGTDLAPLVLVNNKLYFQRMWFDERQVATFFNKNSFNKNSFNDAALDIDPLKKILDQLFPDPITYDHNDPNSLLNIDWQKVAVTVALTRKVAIISGGPGTGKTTTVAKIIAGILSMQPNARIVAAAPTGKAASRLTESLTNAVAKLALDGINISNEAITLHRLLGARADNNTFTYNRHNLLHLDLLVIDEASMVDLNMMAKVLEALPSSARLILLGDKDQLSSVEAGAVFGDLCAFIQYGYSRLRAKELADLTGYTIPYGNMLENATTIADNLCLLQKSYRFDDSSGIGLLANAVKEGKIDDAKQLLSSSAFTDISYHNLATTAEYQTLLTSSIDYYRDYLNCIKQFGTQNIAQILQKFAQYRLLCAVREGDFGVEGLNKQIESRLAKSGLIDLNGNDNWYIGRPIMILRNSLSLGLYNGDIGITLMSENSLDNNLSNNRKLRVYFPFSDGSIKGFSPFRLPEHETAYVMTVHKSQGSEFDHVNIVLPTDYSPILSRSLLYTAITRAKKTVAIYATQNVLLQMIKTQTERQSGLIELLNAP